jgi:hypothetical protein
MGSIFKALMSVIEKNPQLMEELIGELLKLMVSQMKGAAK